jgi:hypothetical protein
LIEVFTEANVVLSVVPMPLTATTMTMLMPAAIRQYSIAVAPDSSLKNFETNCRITNSCGRLTTFSRANAAANVNLIGCRPVEEDGQ